MKAIDGYSVNDDVCFICRDDLGKYPVYIRDYDWYFYGDKKLWSYLKENPDFVKVLKENFAVSRIELEIPYVKLYTKFSYTREKGNVIDHLKRIGFKTYEADVDPLKRYMIDHPEVEITDQYKILFIDIETDDRPRPGHATNDLS